MKNTNKLSEALNNYRYPKFYFIYPTILKLQHFVTYIITLRNWYSRKVILNTIKTCKPGSAILDAGSGAGDFTLFLANKFPALDFTGIDRCEENISVCSNYIRKKRIKNCHFKTEDLNKLNAIEHYDVVICITVLQYVSDDISALKNIYNCLKPEGKFILYAPVNYKYYFKCFGKLKEKIFKNKNYDDSQNIQRRYTIDKISNIILNSGFEIENTVNTYGKFGKISYEIQTTFLLILERLPLLLAPLLIAVYIVLFFPFTIIINLMDYFIPNTDGNGLIITARKRKT
jgi:2-polyprenyl-3-methyl-5-hydroxy-6-metoxy-1,4-benzoquinol methylase